MSLVDKVVLVTGAGSMHGGLGNGKACAISYARAGAKVCLLDIDLDAAKLTQDIIVAEGHEALAVAGDVTRESSMQGAIQTCLEHFGQIDVLHNNVGILKARL
jgi:NAD(P)-dependent dehydrogenase (short-subunit alcohol dehydrogenase family)